MGIFDRFHKKSEEAKDARRNNHLAMLVARMEGTDKENSLRTGIDLGQVVREDAERLGDSILEVYLTSVGSAGAWSSNEDVTQFVEKYNDLLTQYKK